MKRKTAKEILAESFYELSETRDIDKITVKNITDNCGYSPATFYRHFRDKYDLIAWAYAGNIAAIMDGSAAVILLAPILAPIAATLGISTIHFGVIMVLNLIIGCGTPPLGACLFIASKVAGKVSQIEIIA